MRTLYDHFISCFLFIFELRHITRQLIINTVNNLKGGLAQGFNLISTKFIKSRIEDIVSPLTPYYNKQKY